MSELVVRMFGLEGLRPDEEGVRFEFARGLPVWAWVMLAMAMCALAAWGYRRLEGRRSVRVWLACARAAIVLLLGALAAGPRLVRDNQRVERDWVVVLADRSASMRVPDAPAAGALVGARTTRDAQLRSGVSDPVWGAIAQEHNVLWLGLGGGAYELAGESPELGDPDARTTRIGVALEQALARVAGRPLSGVVVLSDGRSSDTVEGGVVRRLVGERAPVFVVPLGSREAVLDFAAARVESPRSAFVKDFVPVRVRVEARGAVDASGVPVEVELVDEATGERLDREAIAADAWGEGWAEVTLASRPEDPGQARWSVRVLPKGGDLIEENNRAVVEIELVDRPLRVVYFEGYPRWDYRFLKDIMVRETSIHASVMLLATDRRYIQEGDVGLAAPPRSSEEWGAFDVVVLGDVRPDVFTGEQLAQIKELVAVRGAGLVWIGGPGSTPGAWGGTELGDLLPFTLGSSGGRGPGVWGEGVTLAPTPAARRHGVLELGENAADPWPELLSDPRTGWTILRWAQRIDGSIVKPAAEVLARATPVSVWGGASEQSGEPAVLTMRYGAGRVVYLGTDEVWRFRYARGEGLTERFWLPLVRLAGRESIGRSGQAATLEVEPAVGTLGEPVRLTLRLVDQSLVSVAPPMMRVVVAPTGASGARPEVMELAPEGPGVFAGTWIPTEGGEYRATASDAIVVASGLAAEFRVLLPDDEMRTPQADHAFLESLAGATGGVVLAPEALGRLAGLLPNRQVIVEGEPQVETLWDRPVVLVVLVALLAAEWVGRRLARLA